MRALTERELEVFGLIARGLSHDEIAVGLVVSPATVKTHVNRIPARLGQRTRVQLVVLGYETGLVRPNAGQQAGFTVLPQAPDITPRGHL